VPVDVTHTPATSARGDWAQRVQGCLLLAACGDALGAPFEGSAPVDPAEVDAWMHDPTRLRWTDDTAMMRVLAAHLVRRAGVVDRDELAVEFAREWSRDPDRGYGPGAAQVLGAVGGGEPWAHAASRIFAGQGSFGNGAAMRVAPVGLLPGLGLSAVAGRADRSAVVTHTHRFGRDGAVVQAVAVAVAARWPGSDPVSADRFLSRVAVHARTPQFRQMLAQVATLVSARATPVEVADQVGNDTAALGSVPAALAAFLSYPDQPRAALRFAICTGGDTDTIAAMTGALCGTRGGAGVLPALWTRRLEDATHMTRLATTLARLSRNAGKPGSAVPWPDRGSDPRQSTRKARARWAETG
jgi:poly(ADP-ribose) glycohydrolase ARH3